MMPENCIFQTLEKNYKHLNVEIRFTYPNLGLLLLFRGNLAIFFGFIARCWLS